MNRFALWDRKIISSLNRIWEPLSRIALFVAYGWFGGLKVVGASPATPLVNALQALTLSFIDPGVFMVAFGLFEVLIGLLFLMHGKERLAIALMAAHLCMTFLPLVLLPDIVWSGFMIPTLEGQYIIKNLALAAVAIGIGSRLVPWEAKGHKD